MGYVIEKESIIETIQCEGIFDAFLYDNSIIEVKWNHELKEIEKQHLISLTDAVKSLGKGKKMRVYVATFDFMTMNDESRIYSSSETAERYTLASAVLVDNLAKKILFNFYLKFGKPNAPIRAFNLKSKAFEWLLSIDD